MVKKFMIGRYAKVIKIIKGKEEYYEQIGRITRIDEDFWYGDKTYYLKFQDGLLISFNIKDLYVIPESLED